MPTEDITIAATRSIRPKAISAPNPSPLPVLAFPTNEVLLRKALPPVIIAAIPVGTDNRIMNRTNKPNKMKPQAPMPSHREVEARLSAFRLFWFLFLLSKIFKPSL